jgi:hypothetical protein
MKLTPLIREFLRADVVKWTKLIKDSGAKIE